MDTLKRTSSACDNVASARLTFENFETVRKRGDPFRLRREVEAMRYVQRHTSVPIPTILDVQLDANGDSEQSWILMRRLPGHELGEAWPNMNKKARAQTMSWLRSYFKQLHSLHPPEPGWIGSCSKGPVYDHRLNNLSTCGPFVSISEFHDFLVAPVKNCPRPELEAKYRSRLSDNYRITFAHADFSSENVLVNPETGDVSGILDWEMAGFWPEWWEYRKALFGARSQPWWIHILKQVIHEYPNETEVDMELEMF